LALVEKADQCLRRIGEPGRGAAGAISCFSGDFTEMLAEELAHTGAYLTKTQNHRLPGIRRAPDPAFQLELVGRLGQ